MNDAATNSPDFTVSDLATALKRTLEDRFGLVRVRGEVSGYRGAHASGHVYFCLKDANAKLDAVIWRPTFARMKVRPTEGLEVVATGRITSFPAKSAYQIIIDKLEPAGIGALMALLEDRRRRLAAEGLFDQARKRALPFVPEVVGVVTSPSGSVIRDILHRLTDRFPRRVLVWPVRVQGEGSAEDVAAAIEGFGRLPPNGALPRPSVIIVARGGGSLEDLWGFNDERVVRAAAASPIPIVSAVGHETDWTLLDHVADLRAPTPTGAAEMIVPVRLDLVGAVAELSRRAVRAAAKSVGERRRDVVAAARALPSREAFLAARLQRVDRIADQLDSFIRDRIRERRLRTERAATLLARHSPHAELARRRERLAGIGSRLVRAHARFLQEGGRAQRERLDVLRLRLGRAERRNLEVQKQRSEAAFRLVKSYSYMDVLSRGYAIVRDAQGRPVRSARGVEAGARLSVTVADGSFPATADGVPAGGRRARSRDPQTPTDQGALF